MPKIVELQIVKQERQLSIEEAWQRFVAASDRSKATGTLEDGIAAGKTYAAFLRLFERKAS